MYYSGIMLKAKGLNNPKWILAKNVYTSITKYLWLKCSWDLARFMITYMTYGYILWPKMFLAMSNYLIPRSIKFPSLKHDQSWLYWYDIPWVLIFA